MFAATSRQTLERNARLIEAHALQDADSFFFERFPDREFRLRAAHESEYFGDVFPTAWAFVVVPREHVTKSWLHTLFLATPDFDTAQSDVQIRQLVAALSAVR